MALLNYTTKIDADKTAQEIAKCLSMHGARSVLTMYNKEKGFVEAIAFQIELNGQPISFKLPCSWEPVLEILKNDPKVPRPFRTREQAVRTAWRIVKDWVEAQMALVETQMASTLQVFLPYAETNGITLYEKIVNTPSLLLGDGNTN